MNKETQTLLEARQLSKHFASPDGPIPVLDAVAFSISAGESVSIRGESGSGKSTLLNVLSGLERAYSGDLEWLGRSVGWSSLSSMAAKRSELIGFVFQA